jgi:hypothetical protein
MAGRDATDGFAQTAPFLRQARRRVWGAPANGAVSARTGRRPAPAHGKIALVTRPIPAFADRQSLARNAILLVAVGLFLAALGPFGSMTSPPLVRFIYWPGVIAGGGAIGITVDELGGRRFANPWLRWAFSSVVMTPGVCVLVWFASRWAFGPSQARLFADLVWQVFVISAAVMGVLQLIEKAPPQAEPAEACSDEAFRQRLSARRREARLIAVEAEDHYLRIHTDAGDELITLRFADALDELAGVAGFQTHRSWWAAAGAIEGVRWRRGRGELRLAGGLIAPVSRTYAARLKTAGWF